MPELPEVEHTRRNLERWLLGARIAAVHAPDAFILRPSTPRRLQRQLTGHAIERIERRGKWLRLHLDREQRLFIHLGMTGWFEPSRSDAEPLRFERFSVDLSPKKRTQPSRVSFTDPRRWGRIIFSAKDTPTWLALGPDPYADGVDEARLLARLARSKTRTIKEALLDQALLAGVGNIQAIEALWKAKIDPRSHASALTAREIRSLVRALHWTIERTLADLAKGSGGAKNPFRVYGRRGEPCPRCGTPFARIELGGRTTTFCPVCQRRIARAAPKASRTN